MSTTPATPAELTPVPREHIVSNAGVCGGKPRIAGSRITVANVVVWYERMGMSADEIVSGHPPLTLADVHAALAYYHDNRTAIEARMADDDRFVDAMMRNDESRPSSS